MPYLFGITHTADPPLVEKDWLGLSASNEKSSWSVKSKNCILV